MHGRLATLRLEHPVLAMRPEREQLLVAAWLATYRSVRTRRAYAGDLADWLEWLHAADLDTLQAWRVHVDLWVRELLDAGAAALSTARRLSALSGWYRHLAEHDLVGANPVTPVRRPRVDADHTATVGLNRDQARALIAAADADLRPARLRSAAAVRLLLHLGLRVDELARADVADLGQFGAGGRQLLAATALAVESRSRVDSLLRVITALDFEIDTFAKLVTGRLRTDPGYAAIQQIPGVGPLLGAVLVAEIGDITRFARPQQLASWAGLTPKHHESDTHVHRAGSPSRARRWSGGPRSRRSSACLRDHHIRCLPARLLDHPEAA